MLQLPTISLGIYRILPKHQVITYIVWIFVAFSVVVGQVFAWAWHDHGWWAEAEALGSGTWDVLGEQFIKPKNVDTASIANQSYPWIVMSDEYGSIFSSRQGIVTKLHVNLWDVVRKWQTVATVSTIGNSPEIIALLAGKKADIAVSEWQLSAARNVAEYLNAQVWWPDNATQNVYDQKY